ncbi:3-beta-hydroxysteroid dehydrogenase [Luteitalea pratensis]|uniref:3-beta-hydroxysteroid dehydrogenase n=2 Tax=Luteitalea pratensis TaxID=1855912 RepID=A0A143PUN7_LUTPR|nr:3-beta-hydroxysteroid dehydrogenase [Luteitalea pratensis]
MAKGRLEGRVALVTGAARGIGLAIVECFHAEGAIVLLSDIDDDLGRAATSRLSDRVDYQRLDVSREEDWQRVAEEIGRTRGRLDIVVNNAAITGLLEPGPQDPEHFELASWRRVHAVNLDGVALGCKYAIRLMRHHGGAIVNISSRSGIVGIPGAAAYASSKAAVRNHTKSVALYCAARGYGIRCNSVHPGSILTPMWDPILGQGADREIRIAAFAREVPLGRMGRPDDVAQAVLYLASEASAYVTGTELHVDGGILAGAAAAPPLPSAPEGD